MGVLEPGQQERLFPFGPRHLERHQPLPRLDLFGQEDPRERAAGRARSTRWKPTDHRVDGIREPGSPRSRLEAATFDPSPCRPSGRFPGSSPLNRIERELGRGLEVTDSLEGGRPIDRVSSHALSGLGARELSRPAPGLIRTGGGFLFGWSKVPSPGTIHSGLVRSRRDLLVGSRRGNRGGSKPHLCLIGYRLQGVQPCLRAMSASNLQSGLPRLESRPSLDPGGLRRSGLGNRATATFTELGTPMGGSSEIKLRSRSNRTADSSGGEADQASARRLAREFSAPVGLLDPSTLVWRVRMGAGCRVVSRRRCEPDGGPGLGAALERPGRTLAAGRDEGRGRGTGRVWLCLPVPRAVGADLVALVGFSDRPTPRARLGTALPGAGAEGLGPVGGRRPPGRGVSSAGLAVPGRGWRPAPDLSADSPAPRLRRSRAVPGSGAAAPLRTALDAAAVAWVPTQVGESTVVIGQVKGMAAREFQALMPSGNTDGVLLSNGGATSESSSPIRRWPPSPPTPRLGRLAHRRQPGSTTARSPPPTVELLQPVASLIATQQTNARLYADLKELLFGVIRALTAAIDAKDPYTSGHSERVAQDRRPTRRGTRHPGQSARATST